MKDSDSFYYRILNIKKEQINVELTIERIIENELTDLLSEASEVDGFCKYIAYNIGESLIKNKISVSFQNVNEILNNNYNHYFLIVHTMVDECLKYYLIDPSYSQFVKKDNHILTKKFTEWPSEVLKQTETGENILNNLIKKGYTLIDEYGINLYLGSFINQIDASKINFDLGSTIIHGKKVK